MNDAPAIFNGTTGNPDVVKLLETVLAQARSGQISTVGIAMVTPLGSYAKVAAGTQVAELHLATCILSKQLLDAVETPQGRIVVPRR